MVGVLCPSFYVFMVCFDYMCSSMVLVYVCACGLNAHRLVECAHMARARVSMACACTSMACACVSMACARVSMSYACVNG